MKGIKIDIKKKEIESFSPEYREASKEKEPQRWTEDFDRIVSDKNCKPYQLKPFIRSLLVSKQKEMVEEIEKLRGDDDEYPRFNDAIEDAQEIIKKIMER